MRADIAHLAKRSRAMGAFKPGSARFKGCGTGCISEAAEVAHREPGSWLSICRGRSYLREHDCLHPGTGQY